MATGMEHEMGINTRAPRLQDLWAKEAEKDIPHLEGSKRGEGQASDAKHRLMRLSDSVRRIDTRYWLSNCSS